MASSVVYEDKKIRTTKEEYEEGNGKRENALKEVISEK
jgi:hypothetical protein